MGSLKDAHADCKRERNRNPNAVGAIADEISRQMEKRAEIAPGPKELLLADLRLEPGYRKCGGSIVRRAKIPLLCTEKFHASADFADSKISLGCGFAAFSATY
jgi:hypothetical protein